MHLNSRFFRRVSNPTSADLSSIILSETSAAVQHERKSPHFPREFSKFTLPSLLKACASLSDLNHGKKIHASIITMGLQSDPYIATSLTSMYIKCGSLCCAVQVFDKTSENESLVQDITLWNSIVDGYLRYGRIIDGIAQFRRMMSVGVAPDAYSLCIILGTCSNFSLLLEGKQIHGYIIRHMLPWDPFLETALIHMYAKCARPVYAWILFDKLEEKGNAAAWNAMISGFCENGLGERALKLYTSMKNDKYKLGSATFSSILTVISQSEDVGIGSGVHCDVIKSGLEQDPYVCTSLLNMYARCSLLEEAYKIFDGIHDKRIELWNALIAAYVSNDFIHEALDNFSNMKLSCLQSDSYTISNILSACSKIASHDIGRRVHAEVIKRPLQGNQAVKSALVTMYAKCGHVESAYPIFSTIEERDIVCWGSMIHGFCINKKFRKALHLFKKMNIEGVKSDSTAMASIVTASAALECAELGFSFHGLVIKNGTISDVFVGSALIDMYAKLRLPDMAEFVFSNMPCDSLLAWNSITSCYNRNSLPELSISLLPQIVHHGLTIDSVTITNAIVAISSLAALHKGKSVHCYLIRNEIQSDLQVQNALINMYVKCGCLEYAERIYDNMPQRNTVTWNSMISGYGYHDDGRKAIRMFNHMKEFGEMPDEITFLSLISACSYSGLTEEGLSLFQCMRVEYQIEPKMEHYGNVVDLLGRAGHLDEAYTFIQNMPIEPNKNIWLCLLSACRTHKNMVLGEIAADQLLKMEPSIGRNYIQLLNLYADGGFWEKVSNLRLSMKVKGLKKNPGCSWIEMKDGRSLFFSGDSSSSWTLEIYETLNNLSDIMELEGSHSENANL